MTKPLISVIIPIYNIDNYLVDSIESVINQSIGFEENIQLILVDDGSSDHSEEICTEYQLRHPDNIQFIHQRNEGVSSARNRGFKKVLGTYVHFFDGDDILSRDFYAQATSFLIAHKDEVNFVATKLKFFDEIIDPHPLNDKFSRDRVIDLAVEPNNPVMHVISCVFRKNAIEKIKFDERVSVGEDVKFISDVLLAKKKYGVVKRPVYHYRKRSAGGSALGGKEHNRSYYLDTPKYVYQHMFDTWTRAGDTEPIEYTLLYDIAYRLAQESQPILSSEEQQAYVYSIVSIATACSDEVIVKSRFLSVHQKLFILRTKHGRKLGDLLETRDGITYLGDYQLYDNTQAVVHIDFLTHEQGDSYFVEGYVDGPTDIMGVSYAIEVSGKQYPVKLVSRFQRQKSFLGEVYYPGGAFEAKIKLPVSSSLKVLMIAYGNKLPLRLETSPFTKFGALKLTYRRDEGRLLKRMSQTIYSKPYSSMSHVALEARMWLQIVLNWRLNTARRQLEKLRGRNLSHLSIKARVFEISKPVLFIAEAIYMIPRALILRTAYYIAKPSKKRPIWLIGDRGMAAGDSGEALFRFVMQQKDCPADVFFVISKQSKDFERMKQIGPVIDQGGLRYKLKFLLADKVISSQADIETTNPFMRQMDHYIDLFNFDYIFLQHGVIRHDHTSWLSRFDKNIRLFITSGKKEYDSILDYPYYYPRRNVLLSGLPRYDYLTSEPNSKLILAPTYRKRLAKMKTDKNGKRSYDPSFKETEYRQFYNNLMNDARLMKALKSHGLQGEFYLHPTLSSQLIDFDENESFKVMDFPYDYQRAFREGEMLISDHSSVVFDFAYLKKPIAYAYFDADTFFDGHTYGRSDFFSDEDDGFGQIYYDYDTLVEGVIQTIQSGLVMDDKYKQRVDDFFYKVDRNNSKRVYDVILKLDN